MSQVTWSFITLYPHSPRHRPADRKSGKPQIDPLKSAERHFKHWNREIKRIKPLKMIFFTLPISCWSVGPDPDRLKHKLSISVSICFILKKKTLWEQEVVLERRTDRSGGSGLPVRTDALSIIQTVCGHFRDVGGRWSSLVVQYDACCVRAQAPPPARGRGLSLWCVQGTFRGLQVCSGLWTCVLHGPSRLRGKPLINRFIDESTETF